MKREREREVLPGLNATERSLKGNARLCLRKISRCQPGNAHWKQSFPRFRSKGESNSRPGLESGRVVKESALFKVERSHCFASLFTWTSFHEHRASSHLVSARSRRVVPFHRTRFRSRAYLLRRCWQIAYVSYLHASWNKRASDNVQAERYSGSVRVFRFLRWNGNDTVTRWIIRHESVVCKPGVAARLKNWEEALDWNRENSTRTRVDNKFEKGKYIGTERLRAHLVKHLSSKRKRKREREVSKFHCAESLFTWTTFWEYYATARCFQPAGYPRSKSARCMLLHGHVIDAERHCCRKITSSKRLWNPPRVSCNPLRKSSSNSVCLYIF